MDKEIKIIKRLSDALMGVLDFLPTEDEPCSHAMNAAVEEANAALSEANVHIILKEKAMSTNETKHTSGPWLLKRDCDIYGADGRYICTVESPIYKNVFDEDKSNARLISASPELLEALEKINCWLTAPATDFDTMLEMQGIARAAIAKAKGES